MSPRLVSVGGRICASTTSSSRSISSVKCARTKVITKNCGRKVRSELTERSTVYRHKRQELENHRRQIAERAMRLERSGNDVGDDAEAMIPGKATMVAASATAAPPDTARAKAATSPSVCAPVKIEGGRWNVTRTRQSLDPKALESRALLLRWMERNNEQRGGVVSKKRTATVNARTESTGDDRNSSDPSSLNHSGKHDGYTSSSSNAESTAWRRRLTPFSMRHRIESAERRKISVSLVERLKKRQDNTTYCSKRAVRRRFEKPRLIIADSRNDEAASNPSSSPSNYHSSSGISETSSHRSTVDSPASAQSSNFATNSASSSNSTLTSTSEGTGSASTPAGPSRSVTSVTHAPLETLKNALEGYDHSRIYLAHVSFLDWRDLPGRRAIDGERIWVVGAADHGGRHRTRLLVTGRHWRPRCLSKVNMVTQPVVYAGGGSGSLTADLFLWWFHREFATTAMAMHPDGAILVAEAADYLPPEVECVTADGLVRLIVVPKDCLEPRIVANELRVRLAAGLLTSVRCHPDFGTGDRTTIANGSTNELDERVKRFTLKEAFAELHRAWLGIRSETFARSWILLQERDDNRANGPPPNSVGTLLSSRSNRNADHNDDANLLNELMSLAREAGLDVGDTELQKWIVDEASEFAKCVTKKEILDDADNGAESCKTNDDDAETDFGEDEEAPTAKESVGLLSKVLLWMEREPLDPGLLLAVRSMRETAAMMASKMGLAGTHPSGLPFFCPNGDHMTQPPPAHMGIPPYGALDAGKAAAAAGEYWPPPPHGPPSHPAHWKRLLAAAASTGLTRAPMYPFSTSQYPYPMLSPEMTQVAASWHTPSMYPISPASAGFRSPYPTSLPITSSSLPSDLYRFSPTGLMPPHPGLSPHAHALASHALVSSSPKADHSTLDHNHRCVYIITCAQTETTRPRAAASFPLSFSSCPRTLFISKYYLHPPSLVTPQYQHIHHPTYSIRRIDAWYMWQKKRMVFDGKFLSHNRSLIGQFFLSTHSRIR